MIAWLLACATAPVADRAADRAHDLASLDAPAAEAEAACLRITDDSMRGACLAFGADRVGRAGDVDGARSMCAAIDTPAWRAECFFLVAEAIAPGDVNAAIATCEEARRFRQQCRTHVLELHLDGVPDLPLAVGDEPALIARVASIVEAAVPDRAAGGQLTRALVAGRIARRADGRAWDPALCGAAPREVCDHAARIATMKVPGR